MGCSLMNNQFEFERILPMIAHDHPIQFHEHDKLLAMFIDYSPRSKIEIKALRGFVVNHCGETLDRLAGQSSYAVTEEMIKQIRIVCGNPEISYEPAVILFTTYASIIGLNYSRKAIEKEFIIPLWSNGISNESLPIQKTTNSVDNSNFNQQNVASGKGSSGQKTFPKASSIILVILAVIIVVTCIYIYNRNDNIDRIENNTHQYIDDTNSQSDEVIQPKPDDQLSSVDRNSASWFQTTANMILQSSIRDYDGDGITEGFASIRKNENDEVVSLVYCTENSNPEIVVEAKSGKINEIIETNGHCIVVWYNPLHGICYCYGVMNGKPYQLRLSAEKVFQAMDGRIYAGHAVYGLSGDSYEYSEYEYDTLTNEFKKVN